ncbi:TetR/AcrR family transcriptional regulator [Providencia alcalifaciens]|uniref:TetR/AcrR family transcriptional regulator n=2 Tax=Providencia alcalifaciens TaxID=126385 RepID=UPI000450F19B|nr:TetR/AcrR family transcriptional regulator [Providencia alcalifaciens]ETT03651.1 transcriptional regulator, TetR family [Providencia alcalifaciens F90-2004]EUC95234.1 transcriptional regulator, TetR family [Providencia alcalifaciens PAL-2]MBF0691874.1 TetR/AcrR family transcriptional regulator [Providencia alcalifaciens]MTB34581.1 TetR family transcriptional regulator [Providencia alcalifaciens]MTC98321.1 TetR family transcriptional regulator [Providencia alcalifaciens]
MTMQNKIATTRSVGRPSKKQPKISAEIIINAAIKFIDSHGFSALSMRALAKEMGINPMTIYYYFEDKECLVKSIANHLYADIKPNLSDTPSEQIKQLLTEYRGYIVRYPELTLSIFNHPNTFPEQAKRITDTLINLAMKLSLTPEQATLWMYILVDFTHGAALAVSNRQNMDNDISDINYYHQGIDALLRNLNKDYI